MTPKGLYNLGNTCYINSVLQNFIYSDTFKEKVQNTELRKIIESEDKIISIKSFNEYFLSKYTFFERFIQHDAHEFLTCFIDLLSEDNKSFNEDFYGKTKLSIKCTMCNNSKEVFEDFSSINLTVNKSNLYELFESYLSKEIHDDPENLYFCDHCNCNCISEKKIRLHILPKTLIIVFKRYSKNKKISDNIDFPKDSLKIRESSTSKIIEYKLTGIVNHFGNLSDGHYNSFVNVNNKWYFMDDDLVIERDSINKSQSYILFYNVKI